MTAGRIYKLVGSIALCAVIWILAEQTYRAYRETLAEPVLDGLSRGAPADSLPPAEVLTVTLPPLEDLTETIERPMFSQSRRPAETATDPLGPAVTTDLDFELVGIVIWQGQRIALVRSSAESRIIRVEVGGNVAGWVAVGIEPESVLFRNGKMDREVRLKYINRDNNG
jgi:hypothetical protein